MDLAEKGFHALSVAERIMSTFIVYYWKASYSKVPLKVRIESFPQNWRARAVRAAPGMWRPQQYPRPTLSR
jgi:hypothetical protein